LFPCPLEAEEVVAVLRPLWNHLTHVWLSLGSFDPNRYFAMAGMTGQGTSMDFIWVTRRSGRAFGEGLT